MSHSRPTGTCSVCGRTLPLSELYPIRLLSDEVCQILRDQHPEIDLEGMVCADDRGRLRAEHVRQLIEEERREVTSLDKQVIDSLHECDLIVENVNKLHDSSLTVGQRIADRVASFGGSWAFILTFVSILVVWIIVNSIALLHKPFDPYPFILLNLVLSCVAALQAPVIMMSQNRQAAKDRLQSEEDYRVNLKAEVEIRNISMKLDEMMLRQWQRLLELQQQQLELLESIQARKKD